MCLYPKLIVNKKYTKTKKNKGIVPIITDERTRYVPVGCGKCIECRAKKAREWQVRLQEEIKYTPFAQFVTLTFNEPSLKKLQDDIKSWDYNKQDNEIAIRATRLFLERWRKSHKKSIKHWLVTELGHTNTERIHLHGILWTNKPEKIEKYWKYGWVYIGDYVNNQTINYIVKYVNKIDKDHKWFQSVILVSPGLGKNYLNLTNIKKNRFNHQDSTKTIESYKTTSGHNIALPIYLRNKIYTEKEREQLWIDKLNKNERYVLGRKINVSTPEGQKLYELARKEAQIKNERLGYLKPQWESDLYKEKEIELKNLTKINTDKKNLPNIAEQTNTYNYEPNKNFDNETNM